MWYEMGKAELNDRRQRADQAQLAKQAQAGKSGLLSGLMEKTGDLLVGIGEQLKHETPTVREEPRVRWAD